MKRVRAQGCHTLYKSQVILSTKDTPLVPKLCIKSQHDGVLHRPPVIPFPATSVLEAVGGIERACRRVRLAHLEVDLPDASADQRFQDVLHERAAEPIPATRRCDREVQDLTLVGSVEGDDVTDDRAPPAPHAPPASPTPPTISFCDEELRERHAVPEVLRRPRIAENLLLDRVNGGDVAELSGTNSEGGGRGGSPI